MRQCFTLITAGLLLSGAAAAAPAQHPVLTRGAAMSGDIFSDPRAETLEHKTTEGPARTRDLVTYDSADKCFQTGVYEATASDEPITPYPIDEFMHFLQGGVTLTSADGTVTEVAAGDSVLIPKGWSGRWTTPGYRKIYITYGCAEKP